jgi:PTH1 family peptidyl-tRNA hydrolase
MFESLAKLVRHHPEGGSPPYLIAGLGNPGREYRESRHNAGFMAIDLLAQAFGIRISRLQSKALIGQGEYAGHKVILAKPQTFMNLSGQAVGPLARFYKVPLEQLIVIYDDLDIPLGNLRIRPGGGSAGQKGLASIIERLGTQDFPRIRIGIGRPSGNKDARDYVLDGFSKDDRMIFDNILDRTCRAVQVFISRDLEAAMNEFNGPMDRD